MANVPDPMAIRVEEAARRLGIGRTTAWSLVRAGELPSVRLRGAVRVPVGALESWLSSQVLGSEHKIAAKTRGLAAMQEPDGVTATATSRSA
ncbi:MAG: helix-turn-helix domain-containing protein [Acidimicrobiales bacterium]